MYQFGTVRFIQPKKHYPRYPRISRNLPFSVAGFLQNYYKLCGFFGRPVLNVAERITQASHIALGANQDISRSADIMRTPLGVPEWLRGDHFDPQIDV